MGFYQKNKNTIHIVGGVTVGIVALAFLLPKRDTTGGLPAPIDEEGNTLTPQGYVFDAQSVADQLFMLMNGYGYFNSIEILEIFKTRVPQTIGAFEELSQAFGKHRYNLATRDNTWYPFATERNLIYWIKRETVDEHYITIKSMFPSQPWI